MSVTWPWKWVLRNGLNRIVFVEKEAYFNFKFLTLLVWYNCYRRWRLNDSKCRYWAQPSARLREIPKNSSRYNSSRRYKCYLARFFKKGRSDVSKPVHKRFSRDWIRANDCSRSTEVSWPSRLDQWRWQNGMKWLIFIKLLANYSIII